MKGKIPVISSQMDLVFTHLYDDNFGVIARNPYGNKLIMIMPEKSFIPRMKETYKCTVGVTDGIFIFNGRRYQLAIARDVNEGSIIDLVNFKYREPVISWEKPNRDRFNNPFSRISSLKR